MQIRIQYASTGRGLVKDAQILADILRAQGVDVTIDALTPRPLPPERLAARLNRLLCRLNARRLEQCFTHIEQRFIPQDAVPHVDINIHLETVFRSRLARANRNILIPNQEWFRPEWRRVLCLLDDVACKTHLAMDVFGRIAPANVRVEYMGFTSPTPDCIEARVKDECLHLAGRSPLKGTAAVIEAWARHPEWPTLNVLGEGVVG
ncbi:MAG: hypothetical protein LPK85_04330, partial [Gammaproteobacteria bacterium]|nr:hypothetical protein [Gammaproteobacteria bacterium]